MKHNNLHWNLLREQEKLSSSPVRLRVLMPILSLVACVAMMGWWAMLFGQQMILKSQIKGVEEDIAARKAQHDQVIKDMVLARDMQAEVDQLKLYENARCTYGETFARLAEVLPEQVQLVSLEIPEPPPQNLLPPGAKPGSKFVPLLGPTGTVEKISLRLLGRTVRETPVLAMMESLEKPAFTNCLKIVKEGAAANASPRIHSFRQDTSNEKGPRLLAFDIEYTCRERRFEK